MIRVVCRETDTTHVVCAGGDAVRGLKTFDVALPRIEGWLREYEGVKGHDYNSREIVGFELIREAAVPDAPSADTVSLSHVAPPDQAKGIVLNDLARFLHKMAVALDGDDAERARRFAALVEGWARSKGG